MRRATFPLYNYIITYVNFYPRSPCGERQPKSTACVSRTVFLSTLSLRRATATRCQVLELDSTHFYPRSPCGERPKKNRPSCFALLISIHALLAESDKMELDSTAGRITFLSTLSLRRATTWARGSRVTYVISIHALLAESDPKEENTMGMPRISIHALLAESD